jgi:hypothetical protein
MLATKAALTKQENLTEAASQPALSPLATKLLKPTPIGVGSETPEPSVFSPILDGTPAGVGVIADTRIIPLFYTHDFIFTNAWIKDSQDRSVRTFVYGGFLPGSGGEVTQQGVVVVQVLKMNGPGNIEMIYYKQFPAPTQSGSVYVTDAVGERLILQSTNGTTFYFDVPTRQFVSSLDAVVPTFTPSPMSLLPTPISPTATPQ